MPFLIVSINGAVATVAHLEQPDADRLREHIAEIDSGRFGLITIVEQAIATTSLHEAVYQIENELDSWTP